MGVVLPQASISICRRVARLYTFVGDFPPAPPPNSPNFIGVQILPLLNLTRFAKKAWISVDISKQSTMPPVDRYSPGTR